MNSSPSTEDKGAFGSQFSNTYAHLPELLFAPAAPSPVREPRLAIFNERLADQLGFRLGGMSPDALAAFFAGQDLPSDLRPIAQAYAGHQFGSFTMLGDGREILLGELRTPAGELVDLQLKGSGRTQFSRGGDGRAALGPMLREYVISEAMFALGIPTTRCLAVVTTGEPVYRESVRKGAILTRVAASHIRVGTFEYLAARRDVASLGALADYAIGRHYSELSSAPDKYRKLLASVIDRQASLIAQWQLVGFIHGVMNTDNMAISGETIDYGPCAFMNNYDPDTVFSSIDYGGRYAYGNQPAIAHWNLARFAESLLPLLAADQQEAIAIATETLNQYPTRFEEYWMTGMRKKLGLASVQVDDLELIRSLLEWMRDSKVDYTNTFRELSTRPLPASERFQDPVFQAWHSRWQARLDQDGDAGESVYEPMRSVNPAIIPRNHLVEEALAEAEERDDLSVLRRLLTALASPYEEPADVRYREPPADEGNYRTFCGT